MNKTLTPKQEAFARAVAAGNSQADAYRLAYNAKASKPETVQKRACELMADGKVAGRVAELRERAATAVGITLETHLTRLEELSAKAQEAGQFSAAIAAEIARGKAAGIHVEKTESTVTTKALPASVDEFV